MKYYILSLLLVLGLSSCVFTGKKTEEKKEIKETEKDIEVKYVQKKEGEKRYKYPSGKLKSIVNFKNGKKVGNSETFYESGEKQYDIPYVDGKKHGKVIWYYKSGKVYRETDYVKGKRTGWIRKYWEDGGLKSEMEVKNSYYSTRLREINQKGKEKKKPYITVQKIDKIQEKGEFILRFKLNNGRKSVKFYIGSLIEGKYFPPNGKGYMELPTKRGVADVILNLSVGHEINKEISVIAVEKTAYQNKRILIKKVPVSLSRN